MHILHLLLQLYVLIIFARIILSYFPIAPGSALVPVVNFLRTVTEPVLGPVRRALPPVSLGGMGLDLSPIVVLAGLYLIDSLILR
ncbi:MAG TPA: YggT family protein [Acidimicrobiales bacterium]|nr:YggT family protein [Acidimicrobiales bacterium]